MTSENSKRASAEATSAAQNFLRRQLWVWPLIAAGVLVFVGLWVRVRMEEAIRATIAGNLKTIRDANAEALRAWAVSMKSQTELLAGDQEVRAFVGRLLERAAAPGTMPALLTAAPELGDLQAHLRPAEEGRGFNGYAVLDTNLVVVAAGQKQFIGARAPAVYADQLAECFDGKTIVTPPFTAPSLLPEETGPLSAGIPTMFAAAPIRSGDGRVIAVLGLRILPEKDFTRILATARSGKSGETYAFNRDGFMVSGSRFDDELKRLRLIPDTAAAQSLLMLDLRDPLVNLGAGKRPPKHREDLPFTKAVSEALAGRDGLDAGGYRDYRGVPVVGAWKWLPDFELGLVTQIDVAEALAPLRVVRAAFWGLFGLLTLCSVAVFVFMRLAGHFHLQARLAMIQAKQLGQYSLEEEIGSGAFGTVFRGHHALMRRPVAVKVLNQAAGSVAIARFEREVQVTCQLTHPNTVALYDYGRTSEGLFYYAMEYLDGFSLNRLVKEHGRQPEGRVIHILRQVCASLAEAHAHGLVHRDVKPQNIFLTCRGGIPDFVKVLDFGLVKASNSEGELELTGAHATLGTPLYMSPEAVRNPAVVDALSDVYSLGSVGYELLTGETVFNGLSLGEVLLKQVSAPPDPPSARLGKAVSPDLEAVLMQCLAKKPSARPPGATALSEALAKCAACGSWTERDAREWWKERVPADHAELQPAVSAK